MYHGFTFDQLEQMKMDLLECLDEARYINDVDWEQELERKLDALFDAELEVLPDYC